MIYRANLKRRILLSAVTAMLLAQPATAQEMSLRAVYNALSGVMGPIWVAQDANLFSKHAVSVDLKYLAATTAVQGMVGGGLAVYFPGRFGRVAHKSADSFRGSV
jgi:hypothetical protein